MDLFNTVRYLDLVAHAVVHCVLLVQTMPLTGTAAPDEDDDGDIEMDHESSSDDTAKKEADVEKPKERKDSKQSKETKEKLAKMRRRTTLSPPHQRKRAQTKLPRKAKRKNPNGKRRPMRLASQH